MTNPKTLHYSTVTDFSKTTQIDKYIPYIIFIYRCKTNRFIYRKKELIESYEYTYFDIRFLKNI